MPPSTAIPVSSVNAVGTDLGPGSQARSRRSRGCRIAVRNSDRISENATSETAESARKIR